MNPALNNLTSFTSSGSHSFTVTANPHNVLLAWFEGSVIFAPVQPVGSYAGTPFTFALSPAYNSFYNIPTPWIGYIINPTVGTNTLTTDSGFTTAAVFYNVDQVNVFGMSTQVQRGSTLISSPNTASMTTRQDNSSILKSSFDGESTFGVTFTDGAGETGAAMSLNESTQGTPRWSYKPTTAAGNYTMSTAWSGGGVLYVQSGALKYRGSSGTVTTIAVA